MFQFEVARDTEFDTILFKSLLFGGDQLSNWALTTIHRIYVRRGVHFYNHR